VSDTLSSPLQLGSSTIRSRVYRAPDAGTVLGDGNLHALCQSSNMCVAAQMLGMKGVCYNPEVKKLAP
jgi:hypothetical protein